MLWILAILVIVVFGLAIRAERKQEKAMQEILESAKRIEKLALENERLATEVRKKFEKV